MKLGLCLEAYREKHKLTYRQLAKEIGIDHAVLFKLSRHPTVGSDNALRLINWLMAPTTK
jgi:transcriptional regulator with XRE-family HTH domain